jgi:hypothetical protein
VQDPVGGLRAAGPDLASLASADRRRALRDRGRRRVLAEARLPGEVRRALDGASLHVAPYDAAVAWALGAGWRPTPVFQHYSAYTEALDEAGARRLRAGDGPERVLLRARQRIDTRLPGFDTPQTTLALLCGYDPGPVGAEWAVWSRRRASRCGRPTAPVRARVRTGEPIRVHARPGALTVLRVGGLGPVGAERLRTLAYRAAMRYVDLDGRRARLAPEVLEGGLVLGGDALAGSPPRFDLSPTGATLAFTIAGEAPGARTLALERSTVPFGAR